jgi:hypothetical protein
MHTNHQRVKVTERSCGGWLAVSGEDEPIKIGVSASTEEDAVSSLERALVQWREMLAGAGVGGPPPGAPRAPRHWP